MTPVHSLDELLRATDSASLKELASALNEESDPDAELEVTGDGVTLWVGTPPQYGKSLTYPFTVPDLWAALQELEEWHQEELEDED